MGSCASSNKVADSNNENSSNPAAKEEPTAADWLKSKAYDMLLGSIDVHPQHPVEKDVFSQIQEKESLVVNCDKLVVLKAAGEDAYLRIKDAVMRWDICAEDTRVYIPGEMIKQGDVIAISTRLTSGVYSLSYEDVSELTEIKADRFTQFLVCVTTRQEHIADGNYSFNMELLHESGDIHLYYQKRQNLVQSVAKALAGSHEDYKQRTQKSVELTIDRLKAFAQGAQQVEGDVQRQTNAADWIKSKAYDILLGSIDAHPQHPTERDVFPEIKKTESLIVNCDKLVTLEAAGEDAYLRIKDAVMRWDIYGGDTRVYIPGKMIKQGDIIGISTRLTSGAYSLSYEDVSEIAEVESDGFTQLIACVTTRQVNVVDGNYSVQVKLFPESGDIELYYQKRQNLVPAILKAGAKSKGAEYYKQRTETSVQNTIDRLTGFAHDVTVIDR